MTVSLDVSVGASHTVSTAQVADIQTVNAVTVSQIEKTTFVEFLLQWDGLRLAFLGVSCADARSQEHQGGARVDLKAGGPDLS